MSSNETHPSKVAVFQRSVGRSLCCPTGTKAEMKGDGPTPLCFHPHAALPTSPLSRRFWNKLLTRGSSAPPGPRPSVRPGPVAAQMNHSFLLSSMVSVKAGSLTMIAASAQSAESAPLASLVW